MAELELYEGRDCPFWDVYRIYSDGSHYIARKAVQGKRLRLRNEPPEEIDGLFELFYAEAKTAFTTVDKQAEYIITGLEDYFPEYPNLEKYVKKNVARKERNRWQREKRFRRKACLNRWNYFITFTYSDRKHTEKSFVKKLRKCLSNLSTRRGWRFQGVPEHGGETGRLHFHFLAYIPAGQMLGNITKRRQYSKRKGAVVESFPNDFFERKFGRCDFKELNPVELRNGSAVNYLLKYLRKTDERVIYSRGLPTEISKRLPESSFVAEMQGDYLPRYVIFDNVIDWERDIKPRTQVRTRMIA